MEKIKEYYIKEITDRFNITRKEAIKYLKKALISNLVREEIIGQIDYYTYPKEN